MHNRIAAALIVLAGLAGPAVAVNVVVDYSYDSSGFFGAGNPDGAAAGQSARAALDEAARYYSEILLDTFSGVTTPAPFASSAFNGVATWSWQQTFTHPGDGYVVTLTDPTVVADEYRIYAGARSIPGTTLGIGGPGGYSWNQGGNGGFFTSNEIDQINAITATFSSAVENRGGPSDEFTAWGGVLTFDSDASTDWHWDWTTDVVGQKSDFYSVAVHELGHALGLGASEQWRDLLSDGLFRGANAYAANGSAYPSATTGHWANNTTSTILGTSTPQEASLDPDVTNGSRKYLTTLDAAGLQDIGWEVATIAPPMGGDPLFGDYNDDGVVDAADYTRWRDNLGAPAGTLPNDPSSAAIGPSQYATWRANYGVTAALAPTAAPEPAAVAWLAGLLGAAPRRRG